MKSTKVLTVENDLPPDSLSYFWFCLKQTEFILLFPVLENYWVSTSVLVKMKVKFPAITDQFSVFLKNSVVSVDKKSEQSVKNIFLSGPLALTSKFYQYLRGY